MKQIIKVKRFKDEQELAEYLKKTIKTKNCKITDVITFKKNDEVKGDYVDTIIILEKEDLEIE